MRRLYYNKETLAGDICESRARFLRSWARNTKWKRITDLVRRGRKSRAKTCLAKRPKFQKEEVGKSRKVVAFVKI
jgi:hypothetical protein